MFGGQKYAKLETSEDEVAREVAVVPRVTAALLAVATVGAAFYSPSGRTLVARTTFAAGMGLSPGGLMSPSTLNFASSFDVEELIKIVDNKSKEEAVLEVLQSPRGQPLITLSPTSHGPLEALASSGPAAADARAAGKRKLGEGAPDGAGGPRPPATPADARQWSAAAA